MYSTRAMDEGKPKAIQVLAPDGTKVKLTQDDMKEFSECVASKNGFSKAIAMCVGIIAGVVTPIKAPTPFTFWVKKTGLAIGGFSVASLIGEVACVYSCKHLVIDILKSKMNHPSQRSDTDLFQEKDEPSNKELSDYTPNISSLDLSGFVNFSSDTSDGDKIPYKKESSKEEGNTVPAGKKSVTYDDLWKKHLESSDERGKRKAYTSEGTDFDKILEKEPGLEKKGIRVNRYGDLVEE